MMLSTTCRGHRFGAIETVAFTACRRMEFVRLALITSKAEAEADEILLKMGAIRSR